MLAAARTRLPAVDFRQQDIATWRPEAPVDVIFANASLQWVPDHAALLPALIAGLSRGGTLAVQMPDNLDEPMHRLMREVAADGPWSGRMAGRRRHAGRAARPRLVLRRPRRLRCRGIDVWRTTYYHPLAGAAAVVEWLKATGLRPFLARLLPDETDAFLDRYRAAVAAAYPALGDGTVLLPFPRLFIVATGEG